MLSPSPQRFDVYTSMWSQEKSCPGRRFSRLRYSNLHAFPAGISKFSTQSLFGGLPIGLGLRQLPLPRARQAELTLAPVLSGPYAHPALLQHQPERAGQRRTVHGKASAQALLI